MLLKTTTVPKVEYLYRRGYSSSTISQMLGADYKEVAEAIKRIKMEDLNELVNPAKKVDEWWWPREWMSPSKKACRRLDNEQLTKKVHIVEIVRDKQ